MVFLIMLRREAAGYNTLPSERKVSNGRSLLHTIRPGKHPITDEIEESEVTIATLKGEILGEEQRIRFYLYGILAIIGIAGLIVYWSSFHLNELLVVNPNDFYTYLFFGLIFAGILGLATLIYFGQKISSAHASLTSLKADRDL